MIKFSGIILYSLTLLRTLDGTLLNLKFVVAVPITDYIYYNFNNAITLCYEIMCDYDVLFCFAMFHDEPVALE